MIDNATFEAGEHPPHIDTAFNEVTRRYEAIPLDEAELVTGQSIMRLFWCESGQRYVTIPGASLFVVNQQGKLILE